MLQPFRPVASFLQLPLRAVYEKDGGVPGRGTADPFDLPSAVSPQEIEADAIGFGVNLFVQARSQPGVLRLRQFALKHTVLLPLPVGLEDGVNLGSAFVFRNIVTDNNIHHHGKKSNPKRQNYFKTRGGYLSVSPIRNFAINRACISKDSR